MRAQRVLISTPSRSVGGNATTAWRWAKLLEDLGHHVVWAGEGRLPDADLLLALHARRGAPAVREFHTERPGRSIIVALTGTDLYRDLPDDEDAQASLALSDRLIVLQPLALERLPDDLQPRTRVVYQSAEPLPERPPRSSDACVVRVIAHLRTVKDPLRAASASRLLPADSAIRVECVGRALEPQLQVQAEEESRTNPRFEWRGELPPEEARTLLAASHAVVVSSRLEGGANVITEAVVNGVPVLASDVPGNVGLLGADHPGLFPCGDSAALAALMIRLESEPSFVSSLERAADAIRPCFAPEREREAWKSLLEEL